MNTQEILTKLVSFPVLGGQSNLSIIHWINDFLTEKGVETHLLPNPEGDKASLFCRIGPAVDGGVILSGHTDVVPVEGQTWTTEPFVLTEKDDKLYGRGSCDMKGFIACVLANVDEMLAANLAKPIYFAFSYDEEVGCLAGPELAAAIRDHYEERPAYALIGEPSLMTPVLGQKGITIFRIDLNGSAGHSSRIRQEVSAIHEAARLIEWIDAKMHALVAAGHIDERFSPPHSSLHVGTIEGGIAPNVIADRCRFHVDIRIIPQDDVYAIKAEMEAFFKEREAELRKRFPDFEIKVTEYHPPVPPLDTPEHLPVVAFIRELAGTDEWETVAYAAEAGQFSEAGFQSVICGPGSIEQAHRADEFIAIEQLKKGDVMIQKLIHMLSQALAISNNFEKKSS
ncbi:MAG: acetylornithine deacetylase [Bacteroidota bacterium]